MKLKFEHGIAILVFIALLVIVFWAHFKRSNQTFSETFANAPVASTYSNIYYQNGGIQRGSVPPVAPSLFDLRY